MAQKPAATATPDQLQRKYGRTAVELAIDRIREAHELGRMSREEHGPRTGIGDQTIPKFAAERGYRRNAVERPRQFARLFETPDLNQIYRECRQYEFPLGVTLIYRVLPICDREKRMKLLRRVIREGWTQARLSFEMRTITGAKARLGRPRSLPKNQAEAKRQIVSRVTPTLRWLEDIKSSLEGKLAANLLGKINKAAVVLEALVKAVS